MLPRSSSATAEFWRTDYQQRTKSTSFSRVRKRPIKMAQNKEGALAWDREPPCRVPLVRPRRDRTMGSSILASLSEAGGNDPCHYMYGPLPPHALATRIVWNATAPALMQEHCPFSRQFRFIFILCFQSLAKIASGPFRFGGSKSGSTAPERNCSQISALAHSLNCLLAPSAA